MSYHNYEISGVDDDYIPYQKPQRRCYNCPTLLRQGNSSDLCWQCSHKKLKAEAKRPEGGLK